MDQIVDRNRPETEDGLLAASPSRAVPPPRRHWGSAPGARGKRGRGWLYALAAVLLPPAGLGYWQFGSPRRRSCYATAPAKIGDITVEVSATGTLQPLIQVDISSELSGVMRSVAVEENQRVKQGRGAGRARHGAAVAAGRARRGFGQGGRSQGDGIKTTLKETEQTFARAEQLSKRGMTSEQALDTATAARDRATPMSPWPRPTSRSPRPS